MWELLYFINFPLFFCRDKDSSKTIYKVNTQNSYFGCRAKEIFEGDTGTIY